jgi:hypothetical protein
LFMPATQDEIQQIISKSPNKSCSLDPLPTWLLKKCSQQLLPLLTHIVNVSIATGHVPSDFKCAQIRPLIKKIGLDQNNFKNYRPVSNLALISKVIEKVVAARLDQHLMEHQLLEKFQSAYRAIHSTETALLKVYSDIADALDSGSNAVLVLLDLSAAFDTIDQV